MIRRARQWLLRLLVCRPLGHDWSEVAITVSGRSRSRPTWAANTTQLERCRTCGTLRSAPADITTNSTNNTETISLGDRR